MKELAKTFTDQLDVIAEEIQNSEELRVYLEEEEDEQYMAIRQIYEPKITKIYTEVANDYPLQLLALEKYLIDIKFEGLFLPRILGFSVLRGVINDDYKYIRPQSHFKDILLAICNSSNFDLIKQRIGQTIQIGFALSSDIWITNLVNLISNKRIRYFLSGLKAPKFRDKRSRALGYARYSNQFRSDNYMSTEFPTTVAELKTLFPSVRKFIIYRIENKGKNVSFIPEIKAFLDNDLFKNTPEYVEMLALYGHFFELNETDQAHLKASFNDARQRISEFEEQWWDLLISLRKTKLDIDPAADRRISAILDFSVDDQLSQFYKLTDEIHTKGYMNEEASEAVKAFYGQHEGMSPINRCLRATIFGYLKRYMDNLMLDQYSEYFELSKIFPTYIDIFTNQKFNQNIKELCMAYVKRLLKKYTDKRGKDYQDIKRFVSSNFLDLGFLTEKQIVELFKTRRKKKPAKS
jgi:hypothetical protein